MAFCSNCGTEIKDGVKFCTECGRATGSTSTVGKYFDVSRESAKLKSKLARPQKQAFGVASRTMAKNLKSVVNNAKQVFADAGFYESEAVPVSHPSEESPEYSQPSETAPTPQSSQEADSGNVNREQEYAGKIIKCPSCGEVMNSFVANCPACGYELRGANPSSSVQELATKLETIESKRSMPRKHLFANSSDQVLSKTDEQKISLIRSFPIPNTREDLLEFIIMASSNIDNKHVSGWDSVSPSEEALSDAWNAKFEQAYEKAKLSFGHTAEFQKIQTIYEKKRLEKQSLQKKQWKIWIGVIAVFILIPCLIWGIVGISSSTDNQKIEIENARLNEIVEEVYSALANNNYTLARAKAATLVFSGSTTSAGDQAAEKWDVTREKLLLIIDNAEGVEPLNNEAGTSEVEGNANTPTTNDGSIVKFKVLIKVDCVENLFFSTYDVVVRVDGSEVATLKHGATETYDLKLSEGKHKIVFVNVDDDSVEGQSEFNVSKDAEFEYKISCTSSKIKVEDLSSADNALPSGDMGVSETITRYAFIRELNEYDIYYLFDMATMKAYYFSTNDSGLLEGKITGDLVSGITITYDGYYETNGDVWQETFKYKNSKNTKEAVLIDNDGFDWTFTATNVEKAEEVMKKCK